VNARAPLAPGDGVRLGIALAVVWLAVAFWSLSDFGPTWDGAELRLGDQLLGFFADPAAAGWDPVHAAPFVHRPPAPWFADMFPWAQSSFVAATMSAASCWLLWDVLGWLPAMAGYLAAIPLLVALLVVALVVFGERHCGRGAGLLAALLLLSMPRFHTEALSNFKDAPECVLFSLAAIAGVAALRAATLRRWLVFGVAAGVAVAQRPNALFLPFLLLPFLLRAWLRPGVAAAAFRAPSLRAFAAGLAVTAVTLVAAMPYVWPSPIGHLTTRFITLSALGNEIAAGAQGTLVPTAASVSLASVWLAIATTPVTLLAAAALGLVVVPARAGSKAFLLLWLAVPLLRTMLPGMRHYDGIRHILEFTVPLALLAGLGLAGACRWLRARWPRAKWLAFAIVLVPVGESVTALVQVHPYGTCYFSPLVGGLRGAQARHLPDATDYWCSGYWAAADWLVHHAERDAQVVCPVASHVLEAIVPVRWRADLRLLSGTAAPGAGQLYVVYATRTEFYPRWLQQTRARHEPVYSIEVQGGTILEVLRLDAVGAAGDLEAFRTQQRAQALGQQVLQELQQRPEAMRQLWSVVDGARSRDEAATIELMRRLLPLRSEEELRLMLWPYLPPR